MNQTLLAPPGRKAKIFDYSTTRATWRQHGTLTWYVGPAMKHYLCFTFYDPSTSATKIIATAKSFLTKSKMSELIHEVVGTHASNELQATLDNIIMKTNDKF